MSSKILGLWPRPFWSAARIRAPTGAARC